MLRLDRDGAWWFESLSGAMVPAWVDAALKAGTVAGHCDIAWEMPDEQSHRAGVLSCLAAIGAGEVYQACVCTQFFGATTGSPLQFFADAVGRTAPARAAFVAGAGVRWRHCRPNCSSAGSATR